jgi:SAM-dependent methyltransferase
MFVDYTAVTEVTGYKVSSEQIKRMYTRYHYAREKAAGKDVLEVACGSGQGLGYLKQKARLVVGADIDAKLLDLARSNYRNRPGIEIKYSDAHALEFPDNSFDMVILFEAIYYLADPGKFLREAKRVLRKDGILIVCSANKDLPDFNPSPYSHKYFSVPEIFSLFQENGFKENSVMGDCPVDKDSFKSRIISIIKKIAVSFHLVPKTMKSKELLKRLFFGELTALPPELTAELKDYRPLVLLESQYPDRKHKVIFTMGHNSK